MEYLAFPHAAKTWPLPPVPMPAPAPAAVAAGAELEGEGAGAGPGAGVLPPPPPPPRHRQVTLLLETLEVGYGLVPDRTVPLSDAAVSAALRWEMEAVARAADRERDVARRRVDDAIAMLLAAET